MTAPTFIPENEKTGFDPQFAAPYGLTKANIRFFDMAADRQSLQELCDTRINNVANDPSFRIEPLRITPFESGRGVVLIDLLTYNRLYSLNAPGLGFIRQQELAFVVPVELRRSGFLSGIGLFVPYIFVNDNFSQISGREVIAYPKLSGEFNLADQFFGFPVAPYTGAVDTLVLATHDADTRAAADTILRIDAPREDASELEVSAAILNDEYEDPFVAPKLWPFGPLETLYGPNGIYPLDDSVLRMLSRAAGISVDSYQLKQFRDPTDPVLACYQAIVRFTTYFEQLSNVGISVRGQVGLDSYASLDIPKKLGITGPGSGFLFGIEADFTLQDAENLFVHCDSAAEPTSTTSAPSSCCESSCCDVLQDGLDLSCKIVGHGLDCYRSLLCCLLGCRY